jgi:Uma2 family endonuclease
VAPQGPLAVDDVSEPEPDFSILPTGLDRSAIPHQALLIVEVSVSSLRVDLGIKADRYARAGYPEYWVIDAERRRVHVHTAPSATGWGLVRTEDTGTLIASAAPEITVDLDDLFGGGTPGTT